MATSRLVLSLLVLGILLQDASGQPVPNPTITTHNWIALTSFNWPPSDPHRSGPFYFLHGENAANPVFGFNDKLLASADLVNKPTLAFTYWTDTDLGLFTYKYPGTHKRRDLKLNATKWESTLLGKIPVEQWNNFKFENADDEFTIALKDVQVDFTQKQSISQLKVDPLTGYRGTNASSGISAIATSPEILGIGAKTAKIVVEPSGKLDFGKTGFEFELQTVPIGTAQRVKLMLNGQKSDCDVQVTQGSADRKLQGATIKCELGEFGQAKVKTLVGFTVTLTAAGAEAFAVLPKAPTGFQLTSTAPKLGQIYSVATGNASAYLSLLDSQSETDINQDVCYTLLKPTGTPPLELYLAYNKAPVGLHLDTLADSKTFCINDYLALRRLTNFQLTFAVSKPTASSFILTRKSISTQLAPKPPNHYSTHIPFTSGWFYFNPKLNYNITGPQKLTSKDFHGFPGAPPQFWACNIVGQCFSYTRTELRFHKGQSLYFLEAEYLNELAKWPFIRIKCDKGPVTDDMYKFEYNRNQNARTLASLVADFHAANPEMPNFGMPIHGTTYFQPFSAPKTTHLKFGFVLRFLDLRVNQANLSVHSVAHIHDTHDSLRLESLVFIRTSDRRTSDFTELYKAKNPATSKGFTISTADFFYADAYETGATIDGRFEITISALPGGNKSHADMAMEFKLVDPAQVKPNFKLLPVTIPANAHYRILNSAIDPKVIVSSGQIHSGPNRVLPEYAIKLTLTSYDEKPFKAGDLKVNQILVSQGNIITTDKSSLIKINGNGSAASFEDKRDPKDIGKLDGPLFELLYEIVLVNGDRQIEVGIESFELKATEVKQTLTGPLIATVNPTIDPVECPAGFKANANQTLCTFDYLYSQSAITCNADCSNIFDRPLLKTSLTSSSQPVKYIPYQPNGNGTHFLQISSPALKANEDFCISFHYKSTKYPLVVGSTPIQSSSQLEFAIGETDQIVCGRKLGGTKQFYFRFNQVPIADIDGHWVQILKAEITHT